METLIHADIFFFVTTVIVLAVGIILGVALVYIIRILRDVKKVSGKVKEGAAALSGDLNDLRENLRENGGQVNGFFKTILKFFGVASKKSKNNHRKKD
ncbi:MAG: hypothetical protein WCO30_01810 [bacterium]